MNVNACGMGIDTVLHKFFDCSSKSDNDLHMKIHLIGHGTEYSHNACSTCPEQILCTMFLSIGLMALDDFGITSFFFGLPSSCVDCCSDSPDSIPSITNYIACKAKYKLHN